MDTRLTVGKCVEERVKKLDDSVFENESKNEGLSSTIAVSAANILLNKGLEEISAALKKLSDDDIREHTLRENIGYFQNNNKPTCIRVTRGYVPELDGNNPKKEEHNLDIEFIYIPSSDGKYYFMQPVTALYQGHLPQEPKTEKKRQLKIAIKETRYGENTGEENFAFDFLDTDLSNKQFYISKTGILNGRHQSTWRADNRKILSSIEVTIFETAKGSSFAKRLSEVFEENKGKIETEIKKNEPFISEKKILDDKITENQTLESNYTIVKEAIATAELAEKNFVTACKCSEGKSSPTLDLESLRVWDLKNGVNLVAEKYGLEPQYILKPKGSIEGCGFRDTTKGDTVCPDETQP